MINHTLPSTDPPITDEWTTPRPGTWPRPPAHRWRWPGRRRAGATPAGGPRGDLMGILEGFYGDLILFYRDLRGSYGDFIGIQGDLRIFEGILWWFKGIWKDLMVSYWDFNGILQAKMLENGSLTINRSFEWRHHRTLMILQGDLQHGGATICFICFPLQFRT